MPDDIFTTDQDSLNDILLSDDDAGFEDDDLTDDLDPLDLEDEEDPDAVNEDSYDDQDDF